MKGNEGQELSSESPKSPRAMLEWSVAMNERPAPVFLALASALMLFFALSYPSVKPFFLMGVIFGIYAIQITIWRAALMIVDAIQRTGAGRGNLAR